MWSAIQRACHWFGQYTRAQALAEKTGAPALREQWGEQAAAIGMTIEEILQAGKKCGRGTVTSTRMR